MVTFGYILDVIIFAAHKKVACSAIACYSQVFVQVLKVGHWVASSRKMILVQL